MAIALGLKDQRFFTRRMRYVALRCVAVPCGDGAAHTTTPRIRGVKERQITLITCAEHDLCWTLHGL